MSLKALMCNYLYLGHQWSDLPQICFVLSLQKMSILLHTTRLNIPLYASHSKQERFQKIVCFGKSFWQHVGPLKLYQQKILSEMKSYQDFPRKFLNFSLIEYNFVKFSLYFIENFFPSLLLLRDHSNISLSRF